MELRKYQEEDAATICSWIRDEKSLYQWSADRIGKFPISEDDLNADCALRSKENRSVLFSAFDDNGDLVGHLCIRYPDEKDDTIVRFGYVIVAPELRGCGYGKKMLQLAIDHAKDILGASKVTLGVFENNDSARYCYESVGFRAVGKTQIYKMPIGEWECSEMELVLRPAGT